MPFNIIRSDITKIKVDAVVNAANTSLLGGSGVDGAIHKAAGEKLLEECRKLGGCEIGQAKITKGYKMPCKYIIHTVGPIWRGGNNNESDMLYSCYKNSMELARKNKCKSIAFPLISSGAYGYPKRQALDIAEKAVRDFLSDNDMDITLVIFDKESFILNSTLADEIEKCLNDNYIEGNHSKPKSHKSNKKKLEKTLQKLYKNSEKYIMKSMDAPNIHSFMGNIPNLEEELTNMDIPFSEKLMKLIDESGRNDYDVYKAANVSKQTFSKIRSDKKYHPKKNTVLAFAVGLKLTLDETEDLLKSAGYALSRSDKTDIIVSCFISNNRYDIYEINEMLYYYDQSLLGIDKKSTAD